MVGSLIRMKALDKQGPCLSYSILYAQYLEWIYYGTGRMTVTWMNHIRYNTIPKEFRQDISLF